MARKDERGEGEMWVWGFVRGLFQKDMRIRKKIVKNQTNSRIICDSVTLPMRPEGHF